MLELRCLEAAFCLARLAMRCTVNKIQLKKRRVSEARKKGKIEGLENNWCVPTEGRRHRWWRFTREVDLLAEAENSASHAETSNLSANIISFIVLA